jgi:hypothetical protein
MAQVARDYAWRPVRADVVPQTQGVKAGEPVHVKVMLLDASGKLTNAIEKTAFVIQAVEPSGKTSETKVNVEAGASSVETTLPGMEAGLTKLVVRQPENEILESSNFVLVTPARPSQTKPKAKKKAPAHKISGRFYERLDKAPRLRNASLVMIDFQPPEPASTDDGGGVAGPQLMFQVSGERDSNVRADQVSYERIAVYYMDAEPAKGPIQVWLTWNHGEVSPNPLIIKKGERSAEAHWTSGWPVAGAKVAITDIKPSVPVNGTREAMINFVEPVSGVAFFNPPTTMSIVDAYNLHARFYDLAGNFVKTSDRRKVTVSTNSAILRFDPDTLDTDWDFETALIPTGWGTAEIEVATPGYPPFTHKVVITYLAVVLLCVAGGLLGSMGDMLSDANRPRGWRILGRMMVGAIAALVICWLYVIVGLPHVPTGILHSQIAVGGLSLLAGWAGAAGLRWVSTNVFHWTTNNPNP